MFGIRTALSAFLLLGMGMVAGCANENQLINPPMELTAELDKVTYRPGEAIICTLTLKNTGDETLTVPLMNSDGIECWYGPIGTDIRYMREPVRSPKETGFVLLDLEPGGERQRRFLLTRVTRDTGSFAFHAIYRPAKTLKIDVGPRVIAKAVPFKVRGEVLLRRDMKGILLEKEAIRIVRENTKALPGSEKTRWLRNEAEYFDWYVEVVVPAAAQPQAKPATKAFLVNPYLGKIRTEVHPQKFTQDEKK